MNMTKVIEIYNLKMWKTFDWVYKYYHGIEYPVETKIVDMNNNRIFENSFPIEQAKEIVECHNKSLYDALMKTIE